MRVFLDSCIVIYFVEEIEPWYTRVRQAMSGSMNQFIVTELVRMECRVGPLRAGDAQLDARFERFFTRYSPVAIVGPAFEEATRLRASLRLSTQDALHLAVAVQQTCDEFWTNDHRLDRVPLPLSVRIFG